METLQRQSASASASSSRASSPKVSSWQSIGDNATPQSFALHDASPSYARRSLTIAAKELANRGLDNSAAWALDLANCVPSSSSSSSSSQPSASDDQPRYRNHGHRSDYQADSSLSWPALPPFSTPARPVSGNGQEQPAGASYPIQSTPFLSAVPSGQHPETSISDTPAPLSRSSRTSSLDRLDAPATKPTRRSGKARSIPEDHSLSGRFAPPFRQPPSPLGNLSVTADNVTGQDPGNGIVPDRDEAMLPDDLDSPSLTEDRSAHVRFASDGEHSISNIDIINQYGSSSSIASLLDDRDSSAYDLALSYFRLSQLDRCKWVLERSRLDLKSKGKRETEWSTFLRCYSSMLIAERRLSSASSTSGLHSRPEALVDVAKALVPILRDLRDPSDAFLLFLKGIILRKLRKRIEAMDCFIRSILAFPYNWTAWLELNAVIDTAAGELNEIFPLLPPSFMTLFFLESHERQASATKNPDENIQRAERLLEIFPDNAGLWNILGMARYMQQNFDEAIQAFENAIEIDPFRTDALADYSNALFLMDHGEQLAHLAHTTSEWGTESAEVCCVVGNHFYFQSDHSRAIEAFKRAIKLDPGCVAAWILLGHTFLEIKNSGAASEMYRRAIDINPRDYRPWHGLGKAYELLEAHTFSAHYYLKAAGIAPYSPIVWQSLGSSYTKLSRFRDAVSSYQRHLSCEPDISLQLASIKNILRLLDHLLSIETSNAGSISADESMYAEQSARRRIIDETTDWHRRAVGLLLLQQRLQSQQQDPQQSLTDMDAADGLATHSHPDDSLSHSASAARPKNGFPPASAARAAGTGAGLDMTNWAESFLRVAKSEAGVDWDFDPEVDQLEFPLGGDEGDEGEDGLRGVRGENAALVDFYLSKILSGSFNGVEGSQGLDDTAAPGSTSTSGGATAAEPGGAEGDVSATGDGMNAANLQRWRSEAAKLRRWLSTVREA